MTGNTTDAFVEKDGPFMTGTVVIEVLVMIFGIIGNLCIFLIMRRKRFSQQTFAVYLSFSAFFDSWFLFAHGLLDSMETFSSFDWPRFSASIWTCKLEYMLTDFPMTIVLWLILALTVDHFVTICFPKKALWYSTKNKAIIVASLVTVVGFIITFALGMHEESVLPDDGLDTNGTVFYRCGTTLTKTEAGAFVYYLLMELLPLIIVSILNLKIFLTLRKTNGYAFVSEDRVRLMTKKAKLERMNGIVFYGLVMNVVTILPFCVVELIYIPYLTYGHITPEREYVLDKAWHVTLVIYMVTFAQKFFVMMLLSKMVRSEFVAMVRNAVGCKKEEQYDEDEEAFDDVDLNVMKNESYPQQTI